MKTERLNLLISREAKVQISARAAALNLSASELIRRAVSSYDPAADDESLRTLADALLQSVERTEQALDAALERLDRLEARLDEGRNEVRDSVRASDDRWPFGCDSQ